MELIYATVISIPSYVKYRFNSKKGNRGNGVGGLITESEQLGWGGITDIGTSLEKM